MDQIRKAFLYFTIYLCILFLSIGFFYIIDGNLSTDFFSFPTIWALWFYFLYIALPLGVLIRLVYHLAIRKKPLTQSLVSVFFLVGLSIGHILYGAIANTYKSSLYEKVKATQSHLENKISNLSATNVSSEFDHNKYNSNLSYKVAFSIENTLNHKVSVDIRGFVADNDEHVFSTSFTLLPKQSVRQRSFQIGERRLRGKAISSDELKLNISYAASSSHQYRPSRDLAQQLCTWSIIECNKFGQEYTRHNTQLFSSSIFSLPTKITSATKLLTKFKLSEFSNLDMNLPFDNISASSEETTIEDGVINEFILNLNVRSKVSGNIYINIPFVNHSGRLESTNITHKSIIKQGDNTIAIPIDINELFNVASNSKQDAPLKFTLFISNNRFWYCPNRICEIVNKPHQNEKFVIKSKGKYSTNSFKHNNPT